ncbi:MAG: hypothetical protein AAB857_01955 [Patescibacteria group bacterium]
MSRAFSSAHPFIYELNQMFEYLIFVYFLSKKFTYYKCKKIWGLMVARITSGLVAKRETMACSNNDMAYRTKKLSTDGKYMEIESKQQILARRKEIEKELLEMLKETKSDFGLDDIKEIIYNEDGRDSLIDIIAMFDTGQGAAELQNVLELLNDAWNYFPHKVIGGLSPVEKLLEYHQK